MAREKLIDYLKKVASDPNEAKKFHQNPRQAAQDAGLESDEVDALASGDHDTVQQMVQQAAPTATAVKAVIVY
jgi:hypothetical protein